MIYVHLFCPTHTGRCSTYSCTLQTEEFYLQKKQEKSCHGYMIMWGLAKVSHGIQIFEMVAGASRDLASKTFSGEFSVSQNGLKNPNRVFKSVLD